MWHPYIESVTFIQAGDLSTYQCIGTIIEDIHYL
jgi:hypothetical protein